MAADFDTLFSINVPHILEKIFFSLDYESFKACLQVNSEWTKLLMSERYKTSWKFVFREETTKDEIKLFNAAADNNTVLAIELLASGMVDVNFKGMVNCGHGPSHLSILAGLTPLHASASNGNLEMVRLLIEKGAEC